ncbi:uncharacterized protein LOC116344072 [Contarinia nasturtii]|uniref:uncharacterized protein LOC116344072 n=1 Tax=Contarinia nasturtii TaxID=265458 RepID=UPI0012D3EE87|nr:uncharacterized protein LOC116344072 [Contarinia nasturtii]
MQSKLVHFRRFKRKQRRVIMNRIVEIDRKDLQILKNLYTPDSSKNYTTYTTIANYIRWFEQDPNMNHIKFFCLNGDFSDGTFVVTDQFGAYADTFNESHENLSQLLQLLDYSKDYFFFSIRPSIRPTLKDALRKSNVDVGHYSTTLLYRLSKEDALKFDTQPPAGIQLRPMTDSQDLEKANSCWLHRWSDSLAFIQRIAKFNPSVGAFRDDDGTLVAWIFRIQTGFLGIFQTDENYCRRGYGGLVLRCISKKIAELGHDVYASINEENTVSRSLFEKYGFKTNEKANWIPTKMNKTSSNE